MAANNCQTIEDLKGFTGMGYIYNEQESDGERLVFIKGSAGM
jgi:cytoplasmic iron level regulating protein YaaA (DUF328/UPF0246 family)